jgi:hypothetical protein
MWPVTFFLTLWNLSTSEYKTNSVLTSKKT